MSKAERTKAYRRGVWAEHMTALYLRLKGHRILARRFKTPVGEIDLIACKSGTLAFVEVKARMEKASALEAVDLRSQNRIVRAARYFLAGHPQYSAYNMRFDVAAFIPPFGFEYLDNAWQSTS